MLAKSLNSPVARPAPKTVRRQRNIDRLGNLFAVCRRLLWTTGHEELLKRGETMWMWQLLAHIERRSPVTQCDLAWSTAQHPAGVSRLLGELEQLGLVVRRRDAADRRRVLVSLTEKGRRHHLALRGHVYRGMGRVLSALSDGEQRQLLELLGKIADNAAAPKSCQ